MHIIYAIENYTGTNSEKEVFRQGKNDPKDHRRVQVS